MTELPSMDLPPETIARADGVAGEVVLRRRAAPNAREPAREPARETVYELIVNGVFLMDTAYVSTDRLLADAVLDRHEAPRRVLVGGLGLGVTVQALLGDVRVEQVDVVEIEPVLVDWLRSGLVPGVEIVLADPRVQIVVADIRDAVRGAAAGRYDAVLLDVDNGPDFLVRDANAAVYQTAALRDMARVLAPQGMLAVWSAAASPALASTLAALVGPGEDVVRTVGRDGRSITYHVYLARREA
jgi:spermidine synthase